MISECERTTTMIGELTRQWSLLSQPVSQMLLMRLLL